MNKKAIAEKFLTAWNAGNEDVVDDLAHDDLVVEYGHFPEPVKGVESFKKMLRQTHHYFPDLAVQALVTLSDHNDVMIKWRYSGHFKTGELFGIPAAGQAVSVYGMTHYQFKDGKVVQEMGLIDQDMLEQQIKS
jgi:steroid delta-isomerase-like uncharacterized protein